MEFDGTTAIVTGGAKGIGRAIAVELAKTGFDVAILDVDAIDAEETCTIVRRENRRAFFVRCNVAKLDDVRTGTQKIEAALGVPQVLINSAGIVGRKPALDVEYEEWSRVIDVNLTGTFLTSQQFAKRLVDNKLPGAIVNITSIFGMVGGENRAAYSASKAGIVNLTRVLAIEWDRYQIRVNAVAPTFVRTPLTEALLQNGLDVVNRSLGERLAFPEQVASAVVFLLSRSSNMITGHTLPVDGGWLSW